MKGPWVTPQKNAEHVKQVRQAEKERLAQEKRERQTLAGIDPSETEKLRSQAKKSNQRLKRELYPRRQRLQDELTGLYASARACERELTNLNYEGKSPVVLEGEDSEYSAVHDPDPKVEKYKRSIQKNTKAICKVEEQLNTLDFEIHKEESLIRKYVQLVTA